MDAVVSDKTFESVVVGCDSATVASKKTHGLACIRHTIKYLKTMLTAFW